MRVAFIYIILAFIITGCVKSIASVEGMNTEAFHNRKIGASAHELLSDEQFTSLKVEVQYMTGYEPDKGALTHLRSFLQKHLHKPEGITIVTKEIAPISDSVLTRDELIFVEKINRTVYATPTQIAVYILYTNGKYISNHVLGMSYRNTSAVIFGDRIKSYSQDFRKINRTRLEATLLLHEMGHLLGLVNMGTSMQTDHRDSEEGKHCRNEKCLMYYAPAPKNPFIYVMKYKVPRLDSNCLADLKAKGGRM